MSPIADQNQSTEEIKGKYVLQQRGTARLFYYLPKSNVIRIYYGIGS